MDPDPYAPGLACSNQMQTSRDRSVCQRMCSPTRPCGASEVCGMITDAVPTGICRPRCAPGASTCPSGTVCATTQTVVPAGAGPFGWETACQLPGALVEGMNPCLSSDACVEGLACFRSQCVRACEAAVPCPSGTHCQALHEGNPRFVNPRGIGFCEAI